MNKSLSTWEVYLSFFCVSTCKIKSDLMMEAELQIRVDGLGFGKMWSFWSPLKHDKGSSVRSVRTRMLILLTKYVVCFCASY